MSLYPESDGRHGSTLLPTRFRMHAVNTSMPPLLCTPLHTEHQRLGAKMVGFNGWEMPLHYGSQIAEHHRVRQHCAMFDVSHMTVVDIAGAGGREFLRYLLANDVARLQGKRQALYSAMLNEHGGIIDDLMAYALPNGYRLVVNCATRDKDLSWIELQARKFDVTVAERQDLAIIAVQGPEAIGAVCKVVTANLASRIAALARFGALLDGDVYWARTGYTGEDGVEIILPGKDAAALWRQLSDAGVTPAGLGARDTLRLEAGLNLYGQDMDERVLPLEANMAWTIAWQPTERDFIGRRALETAREHGVSSKLVGVALLGRGVLRAGQPLYFSGGKSGGEQKQVGALTSGGFSPTLGYAIGMARVPVELGEEALVEIRGQRKPVKLSTPGFVRQGKAVEI